MRQGALRQQSRRAPWFWSAGADPDGAPAAPPGPGPGLSTHRFTLMSTHRMKARPARSPKRTEMVEHRLPLAREM